MASRVKRSALNASAQALDFAAIRLASSSIEYWILVVAVGSKLIAVNRLALSLARLNAALDLAAVDVPFRTNIVASRRKRLASHRSALLLASAVAAENVNTARLPVVGVVSVSSLNGSNQIACAKRPGARRKNSARDVERG